MKEKPDIGEISFPEIVEQPVMWGYYRDLHQANKYKAIVNFDTGKLFSIVSNDYRLIRHEEAIEQIEKAIYEFPDLGRYETFTEFYNDMGRMRRTYRFPEVSVEISSRDTVHLEMHLFNSYDTVWMFIVLLGAFRLICKNGLVVGKKFLHLRKRHVYELDQINLQEEVSTALTRFELQTRQWEFWAHRQLTEKVYKKVIKAMKFGKKAMEEIEGRIYQEADGFDDNHVPIMSAWIFFNVLTWYITYKAVSLNHRVELEKRLRAAMMHLRGRR
jgi:tetratricopeptide (TPR) repeat protein